MNFGANIKSNCLHNFPPSPLPFSSTPAGPDQNPTEIWSSKTQIRVSLTQFTNLKIWLMKTRIWVLLLQISVGFWSGPAGVEEKGSGDGGKLWRQLDLIFAPKFKVYLKILWISGLLSLIFWEWLYFVYTLDFDSWYFWWIMV